MSDDVGGAGDRLAEKTAGYLVFLFLVFLFLLAVAAWAHSWSGGFLP